MAYTRIGLREDGVEPGNAGIRDEALRSVENVLAAVSGRGRQHRCGVGPRPGLRERIGREPLTRRKPRQVRLLLLVRSLELEGDPAQGLHGENEPARRTGLRDLLDRDEAHESAGAGSAVAGGERQGEDVVLAEQLHDVPGELTRLVDRSRSRCDSLSRQRPNELAKLALLLGEAVVGHSPTIVV